MSAAGSDDWMQSSDDQVKRQLRPDSHLVQCRSAGSGREIRGSPTARWRAPGVVAAWEPPRLAGSTGALEVTGSVGSVDFGEAGLAGAGADRDGGAVSSSTSPGGGRRVESWQSP